MRVPVVLLFVCGVIVFWTVPTLAQRATLTQQDIDQAIAKGLRDKGREQGLDMRDSFAAVSAALDETDPKGLGSDTGFSLVVYTPLTWIRQQASQAAKEYRTFAASDVKEELLEPVLRVIVFPSTPTRNTAQAARWASSVQHVVLRDESRKIVIQPTYKEPFTQGSSSQETYQGIQAKFPLDGLREIRGPNGTNEFFVTIIGSGRNANKDFKVKTKHFERLP